MKIKIGLYNDRDGYKIIEVEKSRISIRIDENKVLAKLIEIEEGEDELR